MIEMFSALSLTQWQQKQNKKFNYNSEAVESKIRGKKMSTTVG